MAKDVLTRHALNRAALARQMLLDRERVPAVDAVARLAGMQAQEARPPFVGLWARVAGFARAELHAALHAREVVRATFLRGTLHLVGAEDYVAFRTPIQPMLAQALRVLGTRAEGLDVDKLLPVARDVLAAGPQDFTSLRALLQERFPEVNDRALGYAVRTHLPLVMVPTADRWGFPSVARFTLADAWLGRPPAPGETPHDLVLRYLAAFGPASATDVQTWSGLGRMKPVLESLRPRLRVFADERGRELFDLPDAPRPDADTPAPARFLPEFDNLLLAYDDRTRIVAEEYRARLVTRNLRVHAAFLWDGLVRGTWKITRKKARATLVMTPFEALPKPAGAALAEEGERLLRFVEEDATDVDVELSAPG